MKPEFETRDSVIELPPHFLSRLSAVPGSFGPGLVEEACARYRLQNRSYGFRHYSDS